MRSVTSAYREKVNSGEALHLKANLFSADLETMIALSEDRFMEGATFTGGSCPSGEFTVGGCVISSFRFVLNNWSGIFDDFDFAGAFIEPYLGHTSGSFVSNDDQIKIGRYYIASHKTYGHTIACVAYDALKLMDQTPLSLTYPITAADAVEAIADNHGMSVTGTIPSITLTDPGEDMTERLALSYISALCGKFVSITSNNRIAFKWYDGTALEKETIFSEEIELADITITGVKHGSTMTGTDGYVIDLSDNPFITSANVATVLQNAGAVIGTSFRSGNVSILADPSIEEGDLITFESQAGETVTMPVTTYVYKLGVSEEVGCDAETPDELDLRVSAYTVARNAQGAADEANQKVDDLEIGGRNLFGYGSECTSLAGLTNSGFEIVTEDGYVCAHASGAFSVSKYFRSVIPFTPEPNEVVTISAWVKIKNIVYGTGTPAPMCEFYLSGQTIDGTWRAHDAVAAYLDGEKQTIATVAQIFTQLISDTNWHKVAYVGKFQNYTFTANLSAGIYLRNATGDLYIRDIKYERGNKPTDWTPAPEDIAADITAVETIANNAMTAANGKNTIYHQSTQPTGTFTEGDTWFDTANDYAMYTWDGTAWVLEQFGEDSIAAGAIKAGHIDAGAVTADKIAANAVTAKKMAIGDFTNLATVSENNPATMQTEYVNGATSISNGYIVKADRSKNYVMLNSNRTPSSFRTGDELYFEFTAHASEALSTFFKVYAYTSANTNISQLLSVSSALNIGTSDSKITGSVVLTTSSSSYQWESHAVTYFICLNENFANKDIYVKDVIVRKKNGGELIVDGAITADKIAANAITAEMISGKDITGGTLKTTLGPQRAISQNLGGGLTILDVADPNMCHIQLYNQGLRVVPANSDTAITRLLQVMFADFDGVGIQYGWAVTTAFFSPKIYTASGRVLGRDETLAYESFSAGETGSMVTGVPGVTAIYRREIGVVTMSFANFSFASGTATDSTDYQLIPDLWPLKEMDLISTINSVRFRITTSGYIRPFTATTSQTTIRGTFTFLTLGGDTIVVG